MMWDYVLATMIGSYGGTCLAIGTACLVAAGAEWRRDRKREQKMARAGQARR